MEGPDWLPDLHPALRIYLPITESLPPPVSAPAARIFVLGVRVQTRRPHATNTTTTTTGTEGQQRTWQDGRDLLFVAVEPKVMRPAANSARN